MKLKIILTLIIAVFALTAFDCGKKSGVDKKTTWTGFFSVKHQARTPKQALVYGQTGTPSQDSLNKIDEGLDRVFDIASRVYGYQNALDHSIYTFSLFPRAAICENPGFTVWANDYDGTIWDKDPRPGIGLICAAGLTAGFDNPFAVIVNDAGTIALAARYEGEHILQYFNDREAWLRDLYHPNGGHPLLTDADTDDLSRLASEHAFEVAAIVLSEDLTVVEQSDGAKRERTVPKGTVVCILLTK